MEVTFFGTYNTQSTPRVQTLIDGLRANDIEVNECNVPLKVNTAARVAILKQPWRLPLFGLSILSCWVRLAFKKLRLPKAEFVIVGYMGQFDVLLANILYRKQSIALDYMVSGAATARDRKVSGGFKDKLLIWLDNAALKAADYVIVDTEEHLLDIPENNRHKGIIVAVGAPQAWFDAARQPEAFKDRQGPLRVVFFGLYTPLQSTITIGKALALLRHPVEVTMAGNGQDYEATRSAASSLHATTKVNWLDWADARTVADHDICLGIFGSEPKALKVIPNKAYQGAAVGCGLITSDTPPQRRVLGNVAELVPPEDAPALATAIDSLAQNPKAVLKLRTNAYNHSRAHYTPAKVVLPLLSILNKL